MAIYRHSVQSEVLPFYRENSHCKVDCKDTIQPCVLVAFSEAFRLFRLATVDRWRWHLLFSRLSANGLHTSVTCTCHQAKPHWTYFNHPLARHTCMSNTPCYTSSSQWLWMKVQIINDNTVHPDSHSCISSHILTHTIFDAHFKSTSNTNLVNSSDVHMVFFKCEPYHLSLAFLSCMVEHCVSIIISIMDHRFHLGHQESNGTDLATLCC